MLNPKKLEEIAKQISSTLPPGVKSFTDEVESKTKQVLQAQITKLELITREEFDIQTKVLMRTREKLEAMEKRLAELEGQLSSD